MAKVTGVEPASKMVVSDQGEFHYDVLVLATGSETNFFGNSVIEREAMQLKSIGQALDIRSDFLQDFEAALYAQDETGQRRCLNFVIVGAGPTGVELAGSLAEIKRTVLKHEYRELESDRMQIWLVDSNERVLKNFSEKASANALRYLEGMGVYVEFGARVTDFNGERVTFKDGASMESNTLIWAAGVKGTLIPGLEAAVDPKANRYKVDRFNRLVGVPDVFALGDVAFMQEGKWEFGHPQVAPAAIQQAELLAANLVRKAEGGSMREFTYKDKGSMATIGRYKAVVDAFGMHFGHREDHAGVGQRRAPLDRYASGVAFAGWAERDGAPFAWPKAFEPMPTAAPKTWLMQGGWKRGGPPPSLWERPRPLA